MECTSPRPYTQTLESRIASEHRISPVRLALLAGCSLIFYLLMDKTPAQLQVANIALTLISVYCLTIHFWAPYDKHPFLVSDYWLTLFDSTLSTLWIFITGGASSPFLPLFFVCVVAVAIRHGVRSTLFAGTAYLGLYAVMILSSDITSINWASIASQVLFIVVIGAVALISSDIIKTHASDLMRASEQLSGVSELSRGALSGCAISEMREQTIATAMRILKPRSAAIVDAALPDDHVITAPIKNLDGPDGVLKVEGAQGTRFNDDEKRFLRSIADVLSSATQRVSLEQELMARVDELAEGSRRKDEFLAMLAHELRNPLAPIYNALTLIEEGGAALPSAPAIMRRQLSHLTRLVDDLLDVSRVTRGKIVLQREQVRLADVVEHALVTTRHLVAEREHQVFVCLPDQPLHLMVDRTRLEQVLTNLITNAVKYTEPRGVIRITAVEGAGQVSIRVADNGIGMEPVMLDQAFDLFAQADRSLDRTRGGLGIGLTLVKSLVEMHHGHVAAESPGLGHGSAFTVTLPVSTAPPQLSQNGGNGVAASALIQTVDKSPAFAVPLKVVLVDDSRDAVLFLSALLKHWGHDVAVAYEGITGLQAVYRFQPDVVLLDIGLPGMDGYEIAKTLRRDPATRGLKLVAITGYGRLEDLERARDAGFNQHYTKPLEPSVLKEYLQNLQDSASVANTPNAPSHGTMRTGGPLPSDQRS